MALTGPGRTAATRRLTVLVVSYRRADLLESCLLSVRRYLPSHEVLVWDNASNGTSAVRELSEKLDWVHWTFSAVNVGFAAAVNALAAQRPGYDLLLLNPDAVLTGALARCRAALAEPGVAVVSPTIAEPTGTARPWDVAHRRQTLIRSLVSHAGYSERLRGRRLSELYSAAPDHVLGYLTGCCLLLDRAAWDLLDGFDEQFYVYAEEADFQRRATAAGWQLRLVDEPAVRHGSQGTVADDPVAARRSADLLRNHHALLLGVRGNRGKGMTFLAGLALLDRAQRSSRIRRRAIKHKARFASVVFTTNELCRGGAERQRVLLAGELAERGHPVTLVCLQALGPLLPEVNPSVRVILQPWWLPMLDLPVGDAVLVSGTTNTEIGFAVGWWATTLRRRHAGAGRRRWLTAAHEPPGLAEPTYSSRAASVIQRSDGLIALSVAHWEQLTATQKLNSRHFVVPNGVPVNETASPRRRWERPLRLGMLSRIVEHKNPHLLMRALEPLEDLDWTLDLFGDGPDRDRLQKLTPDRLADRIRWRGWSSGPDHAFAQIDVLCVPSRAEAFPLVIVEAMSRGVPVIASGMCAVPEILEGRSPGGAAGIVVGAGMTEPTAEDWTGALRSLIEHPDQLPQLAAAGLRRQQQLYTVTAMADGYEAAFDTVRRSGGRWPERL